MKCLNTVTTISRLGNGIAERVRAREESLFRDTIIKDGDKAYGYDHDGRFYQFEADEIPFAARFMIYRDQEDHVVVVHVADPDGDLTRLEEFIMETWVSEEERA